MVTVRGAEMMAESGAAEEAEGACGGALLKGLGVRLLSARLIGASLPAPIRDHNSFSFTGGGGVVVLEPSFWDAGLSSTTCLILAFLPVILSGLLLKGLLTAPSEDPEDVVGSSGSSTELAGPSRAAREGAWPCGLRPGLTLELWLSVDGLADFESPRDSSTSDVGPLGRCDIGFC